MSATTLTRVCPLARGCFMLTFTHGDLGPVRDGDRPPEVDLEHGWPEFPVLSGSLLHPAAWPSIRELPESP